MEWYRSVPLEDLHRCGEAILDGAAITTGKTRSAASTEIAVIPAVRLLVVVSPVTLAVSPTATLPRSRHSSGICRDAIQEIR